MRNESILSSGPTVAAPEIISHTASRGHSAQQPAILGKGETNGIEVVYRRAGDAYLLIEFGPLVLDLRLRLQVTALMAWLEEAAPALAQADLPARTLIRER